MLLLLLGHVIHVLLQEEDLVPPDGELVRVLLEEEGQQLVVQGLRQVELPLGHVPSHRVGGHRIFEEHLEEVSFNGVQRLFLDSMESCGGRDELDEGLFRFRPAQELQTGVFPPGAHGA